MENELDEKFMKEAIKLAKKAGENDEVPVGAVIVLDGKIIAKAENMRQTKRISTYHAEILAINKACKKIGDFRLNDATIYVSLEPCVMCLGAIINSRIKRLVYGASINKEETIKSGELSARAGLNHNLEIKGGVLEDECGALVKAYFKSKRKSV